jgi:hypothetical protein
MPLHPNTEADEHWATMADLAALAGPTRWRRFRLATGIALVRAGLRMAPAAALEQLQRQGEPAPLGCG